MGRGATGHHRVGTVVGVLIMVLLAFLMPLDDLPGIELPGAGSEAERGRAPLPCRVESVSSRVANDGQDEPRRSLVEPMTAVRETVPRNAPDDTREDLSPEAEPTATAPGSYFVGRVLDVDGEGVVGVAVRVLPMQPGTDGVHEPTGPGRERAAVIDKTRAGGWFRAGPIPDGRVDIELTHDDFIPWCGTATASDANWVATMSAGVSVTGTVLGCDGRPVSKAEVSTRGLNWKRVCSDDDGRFSVRGLRCEPAAVFEARASGYAFHRLPAIEVDRDTDLGVLWLVPETEFTGFVRDAIGHPVVAVVSVMSASGVEPGDDLEAATETRWVLGTARTDDGGAFRIRGLGPGQHLVTVSDPGRQRRPMTTIASTGVGPVLIRWLEHQANKAHLTGHVWDSISRQPLTDFALTITQRRDDGLWSSRVHRVHDSGGRFEVRDLPAKEAELHVDAADHVAWRKGPVPIALGAQYLGIPVPPRTTVRLEFVRADGVAVSAASVDVTGPEGHDLHLADRARSARSDEHGIVELNEFPAAPVRLMVKAPGIERIWTFDVALAGPGPHRLRRILQE